MAQEGTMHGTSPVRVLKRFLLRAEAGAAGGLIGAVVVAALFLIKGAIHLHPFAVPAALTSELFGKVTSSSGTSDWLASDLVLGLDVLVYTALHLLTFAVVGVGAACFLDGSNFWKSVGVGALYAGVTCTGLLYIASGIAGTPIAVDVLGLRSVLLANLLVGAIIGAALYVVEHGDDSDVTA